ncbi:MAG: DUF4124 domain-containing protein [Telluria sp.]
MRRLILAAAICAMCAPAVAQTVYKCTSAGKVTYTEQPCASGARSATLAVPDAPPPDPDLQERLARQKALVDSLEKERSAAQAKQARTTRPVAARTAASPQQQRCDKLRLQLKWAEEDLRKTAGPATEALRLKVGRQAEALAVECQP